MVGGEHLKATEEFVYQGSTLSRVGNIDEEVRYRIAHGSAAFGRLSSSVWERRGLSLQTKLKSTELVDPPGPKSWKTYSAPCGNKGSCHRTSKTPPLSTYTNARAKGRTATTTMTFALLSVAGKSLDRILLNHLAEHRENGNLLPESQSGFRQGRGTVDMIYAAQQLQKKCREQMSDVHPSPLFLCPIAARQTAALARNSALNRSPIRVTRSQV